jgi:hypothetical protein
MQWFLSIKWYREKNMEVREELMREIESREMVGGEDPNPTLKTDL